MNHIIVDTHSHVISDDDAKYPKVPLAGIRSEWSKERPATWQELSAAMDAAGVTVAAVVQSSTTYGHDNSYLADCVDSARDRITGVCSVGFMDTGVLDQIEYWLGERDLSGLRLFTAGTTIVHNEWLDDERTLPIWAYVAERGIPVCVQTNLDGIPRVHGLLERFPGLVVIIDQVAIAEFESGPPYPVAEPVYRLAEYPGAYVKITTRTLQTGARSAGGAAGPLRELISHFGSERILWGSNWPSTAGTLVDMAGYLRAALAELAETDARNIASGTALRLYPKLAEQAAVRLSQAGQNLSHSQ